MCGVLLMTLQQLSYFLAAVEQGTFTKAAEELGVAQPSLSEQIVKLEAVLGTGLFIRTNRKLMLTEAGRRFKPFAENAVRASRQGFEAVQAVRTLDGGVASFGTFGTAHHYFLADLITEFRKEHPKVHIRIVGYNSAEVARAVSQGELEAGLVMLPVDENNLLVSEPVWSAQVGYISASPERLQGAKTIEAIAAAPLILSEARWHAVDPVRRLLNQRAKQAAAVLDPLIEVEHQQTAFELAARGLGDVIATWPILHQLGFAERLGWVPIEPPMFEVFAFIHRQDTPISSATRTVMAKMREHLQRLQKAYARRSDCC